VKKDSKYLGEMDFTFLPNFMTFTIFNKRALLMTKTYAPKQTNVSGQSIEIGNIEMYYEEYGTGKPVVLLHGFGGCVQNWYPFINDLSAQHRLIRLPHVSGIESIKTPKLFLLLKYCGPVTQSISGSNTNLFLVLNQYLS